MTYATDWKETLLDDEEARLSALAARIVAVQATRNARHGKGRALHRLPIGGARGTFTVRPDLAEVLPEALHVGPFVPGASYPTYVRFSDGSWEGQRRNDPDVRGVALKLVGVDGPKALGGEARTQDFLLIHTPTFSATDPEHFVALVEAASSGGQLTLLPRLAAKIGWGNAWSLLRALLGNLAKKVPSYATVAFWSVAPYRLGPTAAKWSLVPVPGDAPAPGAKTLVEDLAARLPQGLRWEFRVQLYQDATRTPIEDVRTEWDSPWIVVGHLELPAQNPDSDEGRALAAYLEGLSFDPWHACAPLTPLGLVNRARKHAYYASLQNRDVTPEPDGSEVHPRFG